MVFLWYNIAVPKTIGALCVKRFPLPIEEELIIISLPYYALLS